jgi:8-oxo-dGTP pyrophosphatase MutT (NUDIX family)
VVDRRAACHPVNPVPNPDCSDAPPTTDLSDPSPTADCSESRLLSHGVSRTELGTTALHSSVNSEQPRGKRQDGLMTVSSLRDRLRRHLADFDVRPLPLEGRRASAVAVTVATDQDGTPYFLLTRRSAALRAHARQWALPGGRMDQGEDAEAAALRELDEELGLTLSPSDILGRLDDYPTRSGFVISPVVVWAGTTPSLIPHAGEVESVHEVPLADLDSPGSPRFVTIPESDSPVIQLPLLDTLIHAPTAAVLYQFREVGMHGRDTRVAHYEQPVFAWR